jgi:tRNA (guanosine-2'-O-)-methyltransferase
VSRPFTPAKSGPHLPQRYQHSEWLAPNRSDERAALAIASPAELIAAIGPTLSESRRQRLDAVAAGRLAGLVVVLEDLHDPHNGGAAFRSCEAMGIHELHVIQNHEDFRTSSKITQGCDKWLEVIPHRRTDSCLASLRQRGYKLGAAVPGAMQTLEDLDPGVPTAFLLGNEHTGLSAVARSQCDFEFAIPLYGFSESVNLSVATALIVYTHATRRRQLLGRAGDLDDQQLLMLRARYYARDVRSPVAIVRHHLGSAL